MDSVAISLSRYVRNRVPGAAQVIWLRPVAGRKSASTELRDGGYTVFERVRKIGPETFEANAGGPISHVFDTRYGDELVQFLQANQIPFTDEYAAQRAANPLAFTVAPGSVIVANDRNRLTDKTFTVTLPDTSQSWPPPLTFGLKIDTEPAQSVLKVVRVEPRSFVVTDLTPEVKTGEYNQFSQFQFDLATDADAERFLALARKSGAVVITLPAAQGAEPQLGPQNEAAPFSAGGPRDIVASRIKTLTWPEFQATFAYVKPLGKGENGKVDLYRETLEDGRTAEVAIKTPISPLGRQTLMNEAAISILLQTLVSHPGIPKIFQIIRLRGDLPDGQPNMVLVEEYISDATSLWQLRKNKEILSTITPCTAWNMLVQAFTTLRDLHQHGVAHRDFLHDNVLLRIPHPGAIPEVFLVDYGEACVTTGKGVRLGDQGQTEDYALFNTVPPEAHSCESFDTSQNNDTRELLRQFQHLFEDLSGGNKAVARPGGGWEGPIPESMLGFYTALNDRGYLGLTDAAILSAATEQLLKCATFHDP